MILTGKTITFLGDSITEGHGTSAPSYRYDNVLADMAELSATYNYGIGGTRIAYQRGASPWPTWDLYFCGRAPLMHRSDIIVVFGGTNDYGHGNAPFGVPEDKTPDTYCGAVNYLIEMLKNLYGESKIVFMTPCRRRGGNIPAPVTNRPLRDYVSVIVDACVRYAVPVLNLYDTLGIDPDIDDDMKNYAPDGLHLNDTGHRILAEHLYEFLKQI